MLEMLEGVAKATIDAAKETAKEIGEKIAETATEISGKGESIFPDFFKDMTSEVKKNMYNDLDSMKKELGKTYSEIKEDKPANSPDIAKWFDNGGSIKIEEIDSKQVWTYIDNAGREVTYSENYPNSIPDLNSQYYDDMPNECKESTEVNSEKDNGNEISEINKPIQNKIDGLAREKEVSEELEKKYPLEEGYEIASEAYLRDADGKIVRDPETGEARRIDFVVIKDEKVIDSIEVTSKTADKTVQSAKEERIRDAGGNYVRDNNGNLVKIPFSVQTRIERRD